MHRFLILQPDIRNHQLTLEGSEWHHCQNVLRCRKGDRVTLFDGRGTEYLAEIHDFTRQHAQLKIVQKTSSPPPPYRVTLAQALPKNKAMDFIIQKATELGVHEIIPVLSERSTIRLEPDEISLKLARWHEISSEAAKQCGLNWLPQITQPRSVKEITHLRSRFKSAFIASLQPDARSLWDYTSEIRNSHDPILVMIGPEGDFTPAEISAARSAGFHPLSLGPLVLRCDTAVIYTLSTLTYELRKSSRQI